MDEGFLWYGAQRVLAGEVPIRDFLAYDIGRYYWSAAVMNLVQQDGILALRMATSSFQALAIFVGLLTLARESAKQNLFLLTAALALSIWMSPQYRLFDSSLSIFLIGSLAFLAERPTEKRYFIVGITIGLTAVFGRNHGLYGAAASCGIMLYYALAQSKVKTRLFTALASWMAGVVFGYLPVLIFLAFVPGFASAFLESIKFYFQINATNIALPIPWPWSIPFEKAPVLHTIREILKGMCFIALPVFGVTGIAWLIWKRLQNTQVSSLLVSSIFLSLPYAHYAYSRADFEHLALGIFPLIIGIFALLSKQPGLIKWPSIITLCGTSLLLMLPTHTGWHCYSTRQCIEFDVAGDRLIIQKQTANSLTSLNKLAEEFAPGGRTFIAVPFWPGAYAALRRKSPMWEIYALFPRTTSFQQAEIERIKAANPGFAVIFDSPLDGREELRFSNTHPMINRYIQDHFERLDGATRSPWFRIYKNKTP